MGANERMRYASRGPEREGLTCEVSRRAVVTAVAGLFANPTVGSKARFCGPACRQAAYRRRAAAGVAENTPLQRSGGRAHCLDAAGSARSDPAATPTPGPA